MIVSHEHRFIFLKSRKTAGTSVEIALSTVCGPEDLITPIEPADELTRTAYGGRGPQHFEAPPLARRAWNHMPASMVRQLVGRDVWRDYLTFSIERNPWDALVSLYHWRARASGEARSFEEFVWSPTVDDYAARQPRAYRIGGRIAVDEVCRYDRLGPDLAAIWARLALPGSPALPHAKGQARPARPYAAYYDEASRDHVAEVFALTIEAFGFEF